MTAMGLLAPGAAGLLAFGAAHFGRVEHAKAFVAHARTALIRGTGVLTGAAGFLPTSKRLMRRQVLREMPALLDIVTLGLSAGLSFDASLELYCTRYATRLSRAMESALISWRIGVCGRGEALLAMAREFDCVSLGRFAAAVEEALSFGSPLADVLTRQAETIREEQRAEVEEEIERAPVKMLVPLGTLIVPAMLLAILGPLLAPALGTG